MRHRRFVADHFSQHADEWQAIYDEEDESHDPCYGADIRERKAAVLAFVDEYAQGRPLQILDVGCGPGVFLGELLQRGHNVVGMDVSMAMARRARVATTPGGRRAGVVLGDVESLPFLDGAFDTVICIGVLSYLREDHKGVAEIERVVRRGGRVIVALPNLHRLGVWCDPYYYFLGLWRYLLRQGVPGSRKSGQSIDQIMRKYTYRKLVGLFDASGLARPTCVGIGLGPLTLWRKPLRSTRRSSTLERSADTGQLRQSGFLWRWCANHWVVAVSKAA